MNELIKALRYCGNFADREGCDENCPYFNDKDCPKRIMCDAADALEAAEKRIDGLQKLVDINTERCEALRKQLREAHESYEKHLNELEAQLPKEGEWIVEEEIDDSSGFKWCKWRCSVCHEVVQKGWQHTRDGEKPKWKHCPNCGARMRGEHDERI